MRRKAEPTCVLPVRASQSQRQAGSKVWRERPWKTAVESLVAPDFRQLRVRAGTNSGRCHNINRKTCQENPHLTGVQTHMRQEPAQCTRDGSLVIVGNFQTPFWFLIEQLEKFNKDRKFKKYCQPTQSNRHMYTALCLWLQNIHAFQEGMGHFPVQTNMLGHRTSFRSYKVFPLTTKYQIRNYRKNLGKPSNVRNPTELFLKKP